MIRTITDKKTLIHHLATKLRRQAEERADKITESLEVLSPAEIRQTLHELQVHQIELEMQNEELLAAQEALDALRARYFDLYNLAPVGYCTLNEQLLVLEANLTAATLLGTDRSTLVMQPLSRFIHKEDQDIYYLCNKRLLETDSASSGEGDESWTCELRMVKMDGTLFWVRLETVAGIDTDGAPVRRLLISDINDKKRVEAETAELEAQNRQLQKAESLGRMAGAIAHHFNNQLQVVTGNLELAIMNLPPGSDTIHNLTDAIKASNRATEVSSLMLTYLGHSRGKHKPIDFSEICRRSLVLLQAAFPDRPLLRTDFPSSGPVILANEGQIMQVLTNLVTNGWESADGNRPDIGLTIKTVSQAEILALKSFPIDWQARDIAYACLEVSDAGSGIPEKDIEKIFDPFFSTKFTGRGLGLPAVLGILRAHQGVVTVESKLNQGSIFRVFFPMSAEEVSRHPDKILEP